MKPNPIEKTALGRTSLSVTKLCFGLRPIGDMPDTYGCSVEAERGRSLWAGITSACNIQGGFAAWNAAGGRIERLVTVIPLLIRNSGLQLIASTFRPHPPS